MTTRWDNLVNIEVANKDSLVFPIRVYNFAISMSPFYDGKHTVVGREDRTGNDFWYEGGRNCFWNMNLLVAENPEEFERSFAPFNQGHLNLFENLQQFLSLMEIDLNERSKVYAGKRPVEFNATPFILPKIVDCLPDNVLIENHWSYGGSKIVDIVGRARIEPGTSTTYPNDSIYLGDSTE